MASFTSGSHSWSYCWSQMLHKCMSNSQNLQIYTTGSSINNIKQINMYVNFLLLNIQFKMATFCMSVKHISQLLWSTTLATFISRPQQHEYLSMGCLKNMAYLEKFEKWDVLLHHILEAIPFIKYSISDIHDLFTHISWCVLWLRVTILDICHKFRKGKVGIAISSPILIYLFILFIFTFHRYILGYNNH